jgi:hypothetical protein
MTLDLSTADLLALIVELDAKTRYLPDDDRSTVFAYLGGLLNTVVRGTSSVEHVTEVLREQGWHVLLPDPRQPRKVDQ